jgi:hypothetical protein
VTALRSPALKMLSHAIDDTAESCWLWLGCATPEIGAWRCSHIVKKSHIQEACSQVVAGKYHSLGTSPYGKNLTVLSVSNKGFAHRLART